MEDAKIVELYLKREEEAIRQTSDKYGKRLRSLAYGIVGEQKTIPISLPGIPFRRRNPEIICMLFSHGLPAIFLLTAAGIEAA